VGARQPREQLLESLLRPSARIAEGFATTTLTLHNDELVVGVLVKDQDGAVEVMRIDGEIQSVAWDRIKARSKSTESAMPAMAGMLDKRQLRDLVAFLASLRTAAR
jgi:putative heme-binding domain-containing protein